LKDTIEDLDALIKELENMREKHGNVSVSLSVLNQEEGYLYEESISFISYEYSGKVTLFGEGIVG
jgi:hypothetical protein